jgi:hypothetical protein
MTTSGPFFRRDPVKTFRQNLRTMMDELAQEAAATAQAAYPIGPSGAGRRGIVGRTKNLRGQRWAVTAVVTRAHVYPWRHPKPPGAQYRGGTTGKPARAFSRARSSLRRRIRTDLAKGLN